MSCSSSPLIRQPLNCPTRAPSSSQTLCSAVRTHLSLPLVWHICGQENNSHQPHGKESFITEFKSLVKTALERIHTVSGFKMQIIFPPLSAFKSLKDCVKSSRPAKLSAEFSAPTGVERCWLLLKISSKDPVQSRLNSLDNSFRLLQMLAPAQATLASRGPVCFINLPPNSSKFSASLSQNKTCCYLTLFYIKHVVI